MVFNSITFLIFFAIVLALYYAPILRWRGKKWMLLGASYLFYAAWNPPFVALLWLSTVVDWFAARGIARAESKRRRGGFLALSLATNLGLLGFFKYGDFALENFQLLLSFAGVEYQPAAHDIVLPVGISFYTFQTLSYTLDIYRGKGEPWPSFTDFALYVTFFPQLVAGPIVRAFDFLPQLLEERRATMAQFVWGISLLVVGLFEKTVLADSLLAPVSDQVYAGAETFGALHAWTGTLAFAGQIFCDFAGYSTCAIGIAMCMGFALPDNFRFPYAAIGFSDFWRRWHISLSEWLRDYLYISLGGNRKGNARTLFNLAATMLLGGLWHGAAWTFVVWGALHGIYLIAERFVRDFVHRVVEMPGPLLRFVGGLVTFALVCIAWVFFRAPTFPVAFEILQSMFGMAAETTDHLRPEVMAKALIVVTSLVAGHWYMRSRTLESVASRLPWWLRSAALAGMVLLIFSMAGDERAFIYFQF